MTSAQTARRYSDEEYRACVAETAEHVIVRFRWDNDEDEDDENLEGIAEPLVPAGLKELSDPLARVAEFLRIDGDLIAAAAEASGPRPSCWRARRPGRPIGRPPRRGHGKKPGHGGRQSRPPPTSATWRNCRGAGTRRGSRWSS